MATTITTWNGMLSTPSELHEWTVEIYTEGDCYLLAPELAKLGLGELVAIIDGNEPLSGSTSWTHMAVLTPEGYILDAEGLNDPSITLENYGWDLPKGATIQKLGTDGWSILVKGQAESIQTQEELEATARELRDWYLALGPIPARVEAQLLAA